MNYLKQSKIIVLLIVFVVLLGGYFTLAHFKKTKTQIQKPAVVDSVPSIATMISTVPSTAPNLPVKTTPSKIVVPPPPVGTDQFTISPTNTTSDLANNLLSGGYIADVDTFTKLVGPKIIAPGAYKISTGWTEAQLLQVLSDKPYMKWVVIPPGLRKEEIASLLASTLGWTKKQTSTWITKDTTTKPEYIEGVYFPNTYLIPVAEKPADVAARLISKFNENFAPLLPQFTAKDIKWTSALTLASIVQREAANSADMPLIAGILWNRLNQGMMLDVDSTLQYVRGNTGAGWWAPITVADKKTDSPYNTYLHTGLPPHPIANPSLSAIKATLNPTTTSCLYYLHDKNRITHCAVKYAEHQANIVKYLAN